MRTQISLSLILALLSSLSTAQESFVPAKFVDGPKALMPHIKMPSFDKYVPLPFRCAAVATDGGRIKLAQCHGEQQNKRLNRPFTKAVEKAVRKTKLNPAELGGKTVSVRFNFLAAFELIDDVPTVNVYPNHGHNNAEYGLNYTGPQRVLTKKSWKFSCNWPDPFIWVGARIEKDWQIKNKRVLWSSSTETCKKNIIKHIKNSVFLPATFEGDSVSADYMEAFSAR